MMKIIKNSLFLRICWLFADFLIIWLTVYLLPSPMSDDLPWIYNTGFIPILISPIYFMMWHYKKDIFIKSAIFYLVSILTFDAQIMTISQIFSSQMFNLIFSEHSFFFILMFLILMSISYSISTLILKFVIRKK